MRPTLNAWSFRPGRSRRPGLECRPAARGVSKVLVIAIVALVAVGVGALALWGFSSGGGDSEPPGGSAVARRGDLVITVSESGDLKAKESISIINEVEGQSTIAEIVPEGKTVEKDEVLLRMDSKDLVDRQAQMEADLGTLEAEHKSAVLNLEIQKKEAESAIAAAEQKVTFAKMDLDKYLQGDYPQQQRAMESDIAISKAEFQQAKDELYWTEKLLEKDAVTRQKLETDKLNLEKARISVEQAEENLRLLKAFEYVKQKTTLESNCVESQRELERVKQQMDNNTQVKEAQVKSAKTRLDIKNNAYETMRRQIDHMVIKAPQAGMIVYEKPPRWRNDQPLEVGGSIHYQQKLMTLPDLSAMEIVVRINETEIERVAVGQRANIYVDARQDRTYTGTVKRVAVMAEQGSRGSPDVKVYEAVVSIEQATEGLKPDMSARAEILCNVIKDQLLIPVTGMRVLRGRGAAIVKTAGGLEVRPIETGETNDKFIIIKSGLSEGDEVLLYEPKVMPEIPWTAPEKKEPELPPVDPEATEMPTVREPRAPGNGTGPAAGTVDPAKLAEIRKRLEAATTDEERQKIREEMRALGGGTRRGNRGGTEGAGSRGGPGGAGGGGSEGTRTDRPRGGAAPGGSAGGGGT